MYTTTSTLKIKSCMSPHQETHFSPIKVHRTKPSRGHCLSQFTCTFICNSAHTLLQDPIPVSQPHYYVVCTEHNWLHHNSTHCMPCLLIIVASQDYTSQQYMLHALLAYTVASHDHTWHALLAYYHQTYCTTCLLILVVSQYYILHALLAYYHQQQQQLRSNMHLDFLLPAAQTRGSTVMVTALPPNSRGYITSSFPVNDSAKRNIAKNCLQSNKAHASQMEKHSQYIGYYTTTQRPNTGFKLTPILLPILGMDDTNGTEVKVFAATLSNIASEGHALLIPHAQMCGSTMHLVLHDFA